MRESRHDLRPDEAPGLDQRLQSGREPELLRRRLEPLTTRDDPAQKTRGERAEALVAEWLVARGYDIVARNLRLGALEIDIVARDGPVVCVVEVRTRGNRAWTSGFGSIGGEKRARIRRAGERLWQRRYRRDSSVERLRFDAASVNLDVEPPEIEYVVAAF